MNNPSVNPALNEQLLDNQKKTYTTAFQRFIFRFLPITKWISNYNWECFKYDLISGVTVGIMAIPQSMAYAMLAGLPPQYGLYCCLMPLFVYGVLGTCGQVTIGPCAIISMMCNSACSFLDPDNVPEYVSAMMTLSAISGIFLISLGILHLGCITAVLSETVVTSFTAASAFNIAASQLKHFWGVSTNKDDLLEILIDIFKPETIAKFNWYATIIGVSAMLILYAMKKLNSRFLPKQPLPTELFLIIIYIALMWAFDLHNRWNLKYMGEYELTKGFAPITIPPFNHLAKLLPQGILIGTIAYVITISMGKTFSRKLGYHVDDNQELVALGSCSLVGSFFSAFPCTASLSRSSLIANIGSKTPINTLITPLVILICLYFLMDIVKFIPNACLAAIVIVNLISLFKRFGELGTLWKSSQEDFWTFTLCSLATVCLGTKGGLAIGITTSLVSLLIGCLCRRKAIKDMDPLICEADTGIVEFGHYLHFLNRDKYIKQIEKTLNTSGIQFCVLDLRRVVYIDASAMISLEEMWKCYNQEEKRLCFLVESDYLQKKFEANKMTSIVTSNIVVFDRQLAYTPV